MSEPMFVADWIRVTLPPCSKCGRVTTSNILGLIRPGQVRSYPITVARNCPHCPGDLSMTIDSAAQLLPMEDTHE
jgi:hypothetical protein